MDLTEDQFADLMRESRPAVRHALRSFTIDSDELADLEQEAYIRALISLPALKDRSHFRSWVAAIARNLALERRRRAGRESQHMRELAIRAEEIAPEEVAEAALLEASLLQLPEAMAIPIRLFYFESLDTKSIARRLDLSETAARQRLSRGRAKLKEIIMDTVRQDDDLSEALAQRLLQTAKSLSERGKYQAAVDKFTEAFDEFPGPLTAWNRMPEELRKAMYEALDHTLQYCPPETIEEPEGMEYEEFEDLLASLPEGGSGDLVGSLEDMARRLQISPAWIYLWWKQGLPHWKQREEGIIRFSLLQVKEWLATNSVEMPPKVDGADSYHLVKGIAHGLRKGLLNPDDVEVVIQTFVMRPLRRLIATGTFTNLDEVGAGSPNEAQQALSQSGKQLTEVHRRANDLRSTWSLNCGYSGPYPYDRETGRQIAAQIRQMKEMLREAEEMLETAADSLEQTR